MYILAKPRFWNRSEDRFIDDLAAYAICWQKRNFKVNVVYFKTCKMTIYNNLIFANYSAEKLEELEEQQELNASNQPQLMRLVLAVWFAIISHSDLVCYFMIFLHQIKSATILSLPLPLMVFLWGTLTVPRPTKNFWVTLIAYTEVSLIYYHLSTFVYL